MRTVRTLLIVFACVMVLFFAIFIVRNVFVCYEYNSTVASYWALSEKASTLDQKSAYLDQYVLALESNDLKGTNDAMFLVTPNNSFDQNMVALKSLQARMHEIKSMDVTSFQYQTAIQQITAQEQGEAHALTSTFEGCWYLKNHVFYWDWVCLLTYLGFIALIVAPFIGVVALD